jgi:DNA-binding response OmpR family regulator
MLMSTGKKVLVIDDDVRIARFVRSALTVAGYEVSTVHSGEKGLKMVQEKRPDAILLDIVMPGMNGFEVLRRLGKTVPVIAFSANPSMGAEALRLGAADFMTKPFRPEELLNRVVRIVGEAPGPVDG